MNIEITKNTTQEQWNEVLQAMHEIQIELANEFKRICDQHQIAYFTIAGTTLGAIRHKGFIPWDDDMDFGMLRADYRRFLDIAKYELGWKYFLQNWHTDPNYGLPFTKLQYKFSSLIEDNQDEALQEHSGIFIDIFPYDFIPKDHDVRYHIYNRYQYYSRLLKLKNGYTFKTDTFKKKVAITLLKFVAGFQSRQKLIDLMEAIETECNVQHEDSGLLITLGGWYGPDKELMYLDWCIHLMEHEFEDSSYLVQVNYKAYLTHLYNDYLTLPPEDQRYNQHGIKRVQIK